MFSTELFDVTHDLSCVERTKIHHEVSISPIGLFLIFGSVNKEEHWKSELKIMISILSYCGQTWIRFVSLRVTSHKDFKDIYVEISSFIPFSTRMPSFIFGLLWVTTIVGFVQVLNLSTYFAISSFW